MTDFASALKHAQSYSAYSYADNTRHAYAADWRLFTQWCQSHQRRFLPATPETILGYIGALATLITPATIDRCLGGIAFYHRHARQTDPTDDPEVAVVMRGLRRKRGTAAAGKAALSLALLHQLVAACPASYRGTQERAIMVLGFAGAFRCSELVNLSVADLQFVSEGLVVTVRRSKTDQEAHGYERHSVWTMCDVLSSAGHTPLAAYGWPAIRAGVSRARLTWWPDGATTSRL
jgi:site-specific recombinase XerD